MYTHITLTKAALFFANVYYCRITSVKSPPFCLTAVSTSLTNLTAHLPQSH